jgi:hypothetical protein
MRGYKCNVDALFSQQHDYFGFGMCIQDDKAHILFVITVWSLSICNVDDRWTQRLLYAIRVHELNLEGDFVFNPKKVVNYFHRGRNDVSICLARKLSYVEFNRKQVNKDISFTCDCEGNHINHRLQYFCWYISMYHTYNYEYNGIC